MSIELLSFAGSDELVLGAIDTGTTRPEYSAVTKNPSYARSKFAEMAKGNPSRLPFRATTRGPFMLPVAILRIEAAQCVVNELLRLCPGMKDHSPLAGPQATLARHPGLRDSTDPRRFVEDTDALCEMMEEDFAVETENLGELLANDVSYKDALPTTLGPRAERRALFSVSLMDAYDAYSSALALNIGSLETQQVLRKIMAVFAEQCPLATEELTGGIVVH